MYIYVRAIRLHIHMQRHIVMLKLLFLIMCLGIFTSRQDDDLLGKGLWSLISVSECPKNSLTTETIKCHVNKHKLNRTADGITAHIIMSEEVTESYGIYIDVCKFVDGGCKPYQILSENLGKFCDKYAKDHVMKALKMGNFKNEYFPLQEGEYDLEDYMVDYCNLPSICLYGKYEVLGYLLFNLQRVACLKLVVECKKCEDDEDCCAREVI